MNYQEALEGLGLGEKEQALYLAALELGTATATVIAQKAGIQRTHFYDLSKKLLNTGLLRREIKNKKHFFSATEPDVLVEMQKGRLEKLQQVLPEFKALYNTTGQKPKVSFYEGRAGIDQINEDTLRYKGEMVGFTTPRFITSRTKSTGESFIKKRVAQNKRSRVIGEDVAELRDMQKRDTQELRRTRLLSSDTFRSNIEIVIYGSKIAAVDYKEEWGVIIESTEIANVMQIIFEIVWGRWDK